MGSRGSFLKEGGFSGTNRWHAVGFFEGVKVLEPTDPKRSINLPERSRTPGTSYMSFRKDGTFDQFITFDKNRMPIYRIDYGQHDGKKSLHVHFYKDGDQVNDPSYLHKGDPLFEKHKNLFKGVPL